VSHPSSLTAAIFEQLHLRAKGSKFCARAHSFPMSTDEGTATAGAGIKKKKRSGGPKMNWATYLYKIKNQVHPSVGMASDAMFVINGIVEDYKERLIKESFKSAADAQGGTVKAKHARTAAALLLDGNLLKYTNVEGEKAWAKYQAVA
jgi:hypothetical protein